MFKKPARCFRARAAESSEEEEAAAGEGEGFSPRREEKEKAEPTGEYGTAPAPASASILPRPPGLLSFDERREEGDEEQFKIKKPAVSSVIFSVQKKNVNAASNDRQSDKNKEIFQSERKTSSSSSNDDCEREDEGHFTNSEDSQSSESSIQSDSFPEKQTEILDAASIRAARRKRQLARAWGDYISLDTSVDVQQGSSDADSEDEADDHRRRIKFAPKTKTLRERMIEEISSLKTDEKSEESQEDETQDMWEEQQLRKAVRIFQGSDLDVFTSLTSRSVKIKCESTKRPPVNLEIIKKGLSARLKSVQEIHQSRQREYEKIVHDIESSKSTIEGLEQSNSTVNYRFYRSMKTYIENLADCLNEKISLINKLELAMQQLIQQKAHTLLIRRQADLRSEAACIQQSTKILRNISDAERGNSGTSVNGSVDINEKTHLEECEFRRAKRRQVRERSEQVGHHEGMSSDDEISVEEMIDFQKGRDDILQACQTIFEDVLEDFCSIRCILQKFQEWREKFPDSYYDAYISLCLPKLLNPLIRIKLIDWNPLEEYTVLEQASWYKEIEIFSCAGNESESEREDNSDQNVLSTVLTKTVIPKITDLVECVWDPLSSSQTSNLVQLCRNILKECGLSNATQDLLNLVVSRLKKAIEEDVYIPLYPQSALDDKSLPHSKFQERQFWSAVKLLSNIFCWDGLIQEEVLYELGMDKLLNRYLLLILFNAQPGPSNVEKCQKIVEYLPERWFKDLKSGSTLPQLEKFSKHLLQSADKMYNNFRDETKKMVLLLMTIKALDSADHLIKKYDLEHLK
ncbi:GC-rich sequence DNA-binding factor 2 isoform X2 [Rhinatrema bivittatum]|uniref:GC-rich sequence DNA-binding factor 2 isoform X2 n=1 Tax=Rhinatrema bivittatum TaxID=194408 RepID=UPI001125E22A|nr:GC-rich sequence DNA-binding factor 2 isoform X2 [Rhinatrema bivittatum]